MLGRDAVNFLAYFFQVDSPQARAVNDLQNSLMLNVLLVAITNAWVGDFYRIHRWFHTARIEEDCVQCCAKMSPRILSRDVPCIGGL